MTENEVLSLVQKLNTHFGTSVWVRFAGAGARAHLETGEITYGNDDKDWFMHGEPTVIHEFAHHLDWFRKSYDRKRPHGPGFFKALLDTIEASGCYKKEDHPWSREYNCLFHMARRIGLTTATVWDNHDAKQVAAFRAERKPLTRARRFSGICDACGRKQFGLGKFPDRPRACRCQAALLWAQKKLIRWTDTKTGKVGHVWEGQFGFRWENGKKVYFDDRKPVLKRV